MPKKHEQLSETHIVGSRTKEWIVQAEDCPALRGYFIKHIGMADAAEPYRMVRMQLSGAYLMAGLVGEGQILLDGRWQAMRANQACMAPPHVQHAFHAVPKKRWKFCWVRYEHPADQKPIISAMTPVLASYDSQPLANAILGLHAECAGQGEARAIHHWVELIQSYVMRFAQPWHLDDRLWKLWDAVNSAPGKDWSLDQLARMSHYSSEHLRRLCRKELGRSPMQQVTYLRMQHAAKLLETTNDTIESISQDVGYSNPYVFSNTFKKWTGWRPSEFRKH